MNYVEVDVNNNLITYPITRAELQQMFPQVSIPYNKKIDINGRIFVEVIPVNVDNSLNQLVEDIPVYNVVDDVWMQQWKPVDILDPIILDNIKENKRHEINLKFNDEMSLLVNQYPELERASWAQQEKEARAYINDPLTPTPLLDAMSLSRQVSKDVIAQKIISKADLYASSAGALIGKRQALQDLVNLATTIDELNTIVW